ncbi:hypothetical protein [Xenorhabdus bovienii]|uniref:hypothetical protein n=1 Tax=Xenorhabdus bovienii TaxID=40576 RepID=UPI0023B2D6C2|nr:hypothetical protein [Xenorhabdus bovienii]MDE9454578.1 hypothetical protein [Xenorhabdus bovienii]MDE9568820.1 hypothetical protein [Xenorhabdus bovienii]
MSLSGLSIRSPNGKEIINETDRVGRIVGSHVLPALDRNGYLKKEFHHPELTGMGQMFVWTNITSGFWYISGKGMIKVTGTTIFVELKVSSGGSGIPSTSETVIYYGVK